MRLNMNNRFAVINFSPNLNIRRRTIKLRQLKAMFTFTTLRLHLHTIEYRMPLRGEFRLEIFQFPYWLSNPKFRPPALSFGAQKKFGSESLTVFKSVVHHFVATFHLLEFHWQSITIFLLVQKSVESILIHFIYIDCSKAFSNAKYDGT